MNQYQKRCVKGLSFLVKNVNDENVLLSLNFMRLYLFGEIFFIQRTSIFQENVKLLCIEQYFVLMVICSFYQRYHFQHICQYYLEMKFSAEVMCSLCVLYYSSLQDSVGGGGRGVMCFKLHCKVDRYTNIGVNALMQLGRQCTYIGNRCNWLV